MEIKPHRQQDNGKVFRKDLRMYIRDLLNGHPQQKNYDLQGNFLEL